MKTKILITLVILVSTISLISGNTNINITNGRPVNNNKEVCLLPATPRGVDLNENVPEPPAEYRDLSPVTPMEAPFDEEVYSTSSMNALNMELCPSVPAEADFEEDTIYSEMTISLNPAAPKEADFEDMF